MMRGSEQILCTVGFVILALGTLANFSFSGDVHILPAIRNCIAGLPVSLSLCIASAELTSIDQAQS